MKNSIIKIVLLSLVLVASSTLMAGEKGSHKAGLVKLPHPMKGLLPNLEELKVDQKQKNKIDEILAEVPTKMHAMMDEAATLEHTIKRSVVKEKKSLKDVELNLNKLQSIKREITSLQVITINRLQNILSEKQYSKLLMKLKSSKQCG